MSNLDIHRTFESDVRKMSDTNVHRVSETEVHSTFQFGPTPIVYWSKRTSIGFLIVDQPVLLTVSELA